MSWVKLFTIFLLVIALVVVCLTFEVWAAAFLGLLFALSLNGPAKWLRRKWSMPAWTATVLTMLVVLLVVVGLGYVIGPPLAGQADELSKQLPRAMEKSADWLEDREWGKNVAKQIESVMGKSDEQTESETQAYAGYQDLYHDQTTDEGQQASEDEKGDGDKGGESTEQTQSIVFPIIRSLVTMLSVTAWVFTLILISFVITLFIALNPDVYRRGVLWMIPTHHEEVARLTMTRICSTLRWWMMGRLASMLVVGLLTSLGMWIVGMPAPLALGALAGVLSFVPNIGPIVAALPGLLIALPLGPWMLLYAVIVYVVAQLIESNLITPMVDQYTVTVPAAVLILTQVTMGVLAGAWGVIVATPLLVVVLVLTQQLYVREYIKKRIKVVGSDEDKITDEATDDQPTSQPSLAPAAP